MAVRMWVTGRVQGVGYRDWLVDEARALGLKGWVRNRSDGSVEVMAAGDAGALDRLANLCRQGPRWARVSDVAVEPAEAEPLTEFSRRPTS